MKIIFLFFLVVSSQGFGQSYPKTTPQPEIQPDSLEIQLQIIKNLKEQLDSAMLNYQITSETLDKLKKENEALRKIMREYIIQIDELNIKNAEISRELDKEAEQLKEKESKKEPEKTTHE